MRFSAIFNSVDFIDNIPDYYEECLLSDFPEDIQKMFEDKLNDPFVEIEYERWLKQIN